MIAYILLGLGLVLLIEGLVYALAPSLIEDLLTALKSLPVEQRRLMGFLAMVIGAMLLWGARAAGL
ncbi:DUF2065 family protein [Cognatiyoonia sp.]|uniref:DUF2065 family protein n=1 Tax=Cognatiyoonia sp. TaxID=2211652 RepID=UPI003F6952E9